jgi:integrase/recombinase XerD
MSVDRLSACVPSYRDYLHSLNRSLSGVRRYTDQVQGFVNFLGAEAAPDAITRQTIVRYRVALAKRGCSGATIGNALSAIRSLCKWLVLEEALVNDPTVGIEWPRREDPVVRALSNNELSQLASVITIPEGLGEEEEFYW